MHQLRRLIATELGMADGALSLLFESFAYKRGVPPDADFVFDARCLPNPHWDARCGRSPVAMPPVREWLEDKPEVAQYLQPGRRFSRHVAAALRGRQPFVRDDLRRLHGRPPSLGLPCERLAEHFRATREQVLTFHRELE